MKRKILVIGANGQLGKCLQKIENDWSSYIFKFAGSEEADITDSYQLRDVFDDFKPHFCINASAYTAVDLAESESDKAYAVNAEGVGSLAEACRENNTILLHVSTDYVFSGETEISYTEEDFTAPQGVYGASKELGEQLALERNPQSVVLRTSWLYSEFNKNFVKTMLNLFGTKDELNIVADQYGQPTNANDLAEAIMQIIDSPQKTFGIFHYSNYPETTWFDFAKEIARLSNSKITLNTIDTAQYPTPAKRPMRSTMALDKIQEAYGIDIKHWQHSLADVMQILETNSK